MKRLLAALAGLLGIAWLRRRSSPAPQPQVDHAAELRAKLAQNRQPETRAPEPGPEPEPDVEARRRAVHERARQQIDELGDG